MTVYDTVNWCHSANPCPNGNIVFESFDYEKYRQGIAQFEALENKEKGKFKGQEDFLKKTIGIELTPLNRNYRLLREEIDERLKNPVKPELFPIDLLIQGNDIFDLLASIENEDYIKGLCKRKKRRAKNGINTTESSNLVDCIRQGRSLLLAGSNADLIAKPLIDFYAASAYAYAIIVINSPIRKSIDNLKGSHGHTYNHAKGTVSFGGDIPSGTFLDLLCALPVAQVVSRDINIHYSVLSSCDFAQNHNVNLSLPVLLSMVPELAETYSRYDDKHKLVHELNVDTSIVNRAVTYNF